jgi:fucose permease
MKKQLIKVSLFLNYIVFAMLLNSVGTVIMQAIEAYGVTKVEASVLEPFKDLSIVIFTFFVGSYLPRYGLKRSMLTGLGITPLAVVMMPLVNAFWATKLLFAATGISFGLVKVSVYSIVGLVTKDTNEHNSLMSSLEGTFMVGVLAGYWLFGAFIDSANPANPSWLNVYWVLAACTSLSFLVLWFSELDESEARAGQGAEMDQDFFAMFKLLKKVLVLFFAIAVFIYVLIEQGIGTWLPTFNKEILRLASGLSVQFTSILAAASAIGRIVAGQLVKRVHWFKLLSTSLLFAAILMVLTLPLTYGLDVTEITNWVDAPLAAYIFPLLFLFLAPVYPIINSVILSALPKYEQSAMSGLIVAFSALGGTTGSVVTGFVFSAFSGQTAFYLYLIPVGLLITLLWLMHRTLKQTPEVAH